MGRFFERSYLALQGAGPFQSVLKMPPNESTAENGNCRFDGTW
jgi:hypothetical protein